MADKRPLVQQGLDAKVLSVADRVEVGGGVVASAGATLALVAAGLGVILGANDGISMTAGNGAADFSGGSGVFKTTTGSVTIGPGPVTVSGAATFTGGGAALVVNNNATITGTATVGTVRSGAYQAADGTAAFTVANATGEVTFAGDVVVTGDFTVLGGPTRINSTVVDIADRVVHVNHSSGANDPAPVAITGWSVHRGAVAGVDRDHAGLYWVEASSRWNFAWNTGGDDSAVGADLAVKMGAATITAAITQTGGSASFSGGTFAANATGTAVVDASTTAWFGATTATAVVVGNTTSTTSLGLNAGTGNLTIAAPQVIYNQAPSASGSPFGLKIVGAAHTTLAIADFNDGLFDSAANAAQFSNGGGTISAVRNWYFKPRTLTAAAALTITKAATLCISGPPSAGANVTIPTAVGSNQGAFALDVESGGVRVGNGTVQIHSGGKLFSGAFGPVGGETFRHASGDALFDRSSTTAFQVNVNNTSTNPVFGVDTTNKTIGINKFAVSTVTLDVSQPAKASGSPTGILFTGGAHTALTASAEATDLNFNLARTVQWSTGAITTQRFVRFQGPTLAFVGASTVSHAITASVELPVAGTNATLTNAIALQLEGSVSNGVTQPMLALRNTASNATAVPAVAWIANNGAVDGTLGVQTGNAFAHAKAFFQLKSNGALAEVLSIDSVGSYQFTNQAPVDAAQSPTGFKFTGTSTVGTNYLLASTELPQLDLNFGQTYIWQTGILATQRSVVVRAPTYAFQGASTITTAATLAVTAAPTAGANATITNAYALWIQAGKSEFDGTIQMGAGAYDISCGASSGATTLPTGNVSWSGAAGKTWSLTQGVATTGAAVIATLRGGAHTGQTADGQDILFDLARTVAFNTGGTNQYGVYIRRPTFDGNGAVTITTAATLAIEGEVARGAGGIAITNQYALWVKAGRTQLDGVLVVDPGTTGAVTMGNPSGTGAITVGQSTANNTINVGNAATAGGNTQTINVGSGASASNSTPAFVINIGRGTGSGTSGAGTITNQRRVLIGEYGAGYSAVAIEADYVHIAKHASASLGFFNTTPVPKQTGVAVTAAAIHAALVNYGLIAA